MAEKPEGGVPEVIGAQVAELVEEAGGEVQGGLFGDDWLPEDRDQAKMTRAPGRPKGARNRAGEQLRAHIRDTYKHPLIVLAEIATTPLPELARRLKLGRVGAAQKLELLKLQKSAAEQLAPYLESKMPIAIDADAGVIPLALLIDPETARLAPHAVPQDGTALFNARLVEDDEPGEESEQNQRDSETPNPELDNGDLDNG